MNKEILELAKGLQNSNEPSVATLAKAYLELYNKYVLEVSRRVMDKHHELLKRLDD